MAPYLEVCRYPSTDGLVPVQLNRPALACSSELSGAALVSTSRNKGPNCNWGTEWFKTTPDIHPALSPTFPYCTKRRRKHLPDLCKHQTPSLQRLPFLSYCAGERHCYHLGLQSSCLAEILVVQKIPGVQRCYYTQSRFHVNSYSDPFTCKGGQLWLVEMWYSPSGTDARWVWSSSALEVAKLRQWHGAQDNTHPPFTWWYSFWMMWKQHWWTDRGSSGFSQSKLRF